MTPIEQIRQEIERLGNNAPASYDVDYVKALDDVLALLDTLEQPVPSDAEEAAWKYSEYTEGGETKHDEGKYLGFLAGAEYERGKLPKWRKAENPHPSYGIVTGDDGWDYLVNRNYKIQIAALNRLPKEEQKWNGNAQESGR